MPPATQAEAPRSKDRHKKRQSLHLRPRVHELISALAVKHHRPLRMEVELAVFDYLRKHGVDIPPDVAAHD
jgi:hypothetical protein